jgi:GT2 family glycosyltransferase
MKVVVICLTYGNGKHADYVWKNNLNNAGHPFHRVDINVKGIAHAINEGYNIAFNTLNADAAITISNDILEPQDWLKKRIDTLTETRQAISIPTSEKRTHHRNEVVIGNMLITKEVFNKVGYNDTHYDQFGYGPIDLEYDARLKKAGFLPSYVLNEKAVHLDNGNDAYGFSKREAVQKTRHDYLSRLGRIKTGDMTINIQTLPK